MSRIKFVRNIAAALLVLSLLLCLGRCSVPFPLSFWKPSSAVDPFDAAAAAALADWVSRVQGQGSDVTIAGTQTAVLAYIKGLMTDGVWDRLVRHSIYAGDDINALKAPLKNGGGTATDAINNFVGGDYSQTNGLTGSTSAPTKHIDTGTACNSTAGGMGDQDVHWSVYSDSNNDAGISWQAVFAATDQFLLTSYLSSGNIHWRSGQDNSDIVTVATGQIGHFIGSRTSNTSSVLYKNGTSIGSSANAGGARLSVNIMLHCQNFGGTPQVPTAQTLEMYSFGLGLTSTQAANFTTRYATLRTALGR